MVVSPAVLSKDKKTKKATVSFSDAVRSTAGPVASTSKVPIVSSNKVEDDAQMDDEDDGVEGDGEWQSRQSAAHPSGSAAGEDKAVGAEGENVDNDDDDAVMIDSNTLLPPVGSSNAQSGASAEADQGLLKFPALSAKDMQGKVETQSRKVSVRDHFTSIYLHSTHTILQAAVADVHSPFLSILSICAT